MKRKITSLIAKMFFARTKETTRLNKMLLAFCFLILLTMGTFAQNPIPASEIDYPGASATVPFIAIDTPTAPYMVHAYGGSMAVELYNINRQFDFSGNVPFFNPNTNNLDLATIQAWYNGQSVNMTPTDETGLPGRVEKTTFNGIPVTMVRYNAGDGITEGKCRTQLNAWTIPSRTHTRWELEVAFGKADGVNDWALTPSDPTHLDYSPVLIWQVGSETQGNPVLALNVDTDPLDSTKLWLEVKQKANGQTAPVTIGVMHGISRYTMVPIVIDAFMDERLPSNGGKGIVQVRINNQLVTDTIHATQDAGDGDMKWHMDTYLFYEAAPYAHTRATFWKTARMFVYPVDATAPSAPTNLSATNIASGSFTLNWTASTDNVGVTGYEVFKNGVSIGTTTATTINVTGLAASTQYSMTVKARDLAGNWSAASTTLPVTTLNASCKTSTAAWQGWLIASQTGTFSTTFDVTPAGTVANIIIGLSNGAATGYTSMGPIIAFQDVNIIQARNGGAYESLTSIPYTPGTLYHFRLVINVAARTYSAYVTPQGGNEITIGLNYAFRSDQSPIGNLNYWNLIASGGLGDAVCNFSISDTSAPSIPSGLSVTSITSGSFTLNWTASTDNVGVTGYEVFKDGSSIGTTTATTMNVSGLAPSTTYSMTVKARDAAGNWSAASSASNVITLDASCKASTASFQGFPISSQSGTFTATFDATPAGAAADFVIGLSNGAATGYTSMGPIISFTSANVIQARDGAAYTALTSIPYSPGTVYHFQLDINVAARTYSAYVTPQGGSKLTIGTNYAFRTDQSPVGSLNYWNEITSGILNDEVCYFTILDATSPTAPTGLSATNITSGSFTLNWTASTDNVGVTGYEVFKDGSSIGTTTATTMNVSGLAGLTQYSMTVKARDAAGNWSAASTALPVTTLDISCKASTASFQGFPISSQSGTFTATFDATPAGVAADFVIGLSNGAATGYTSMGPIISFTAANVIQARNGGAYTALTSIPYTPGTLYHLRLLINVAARTYSAYVTPQGGSELTIGTNYAFRTDQSPVGNLNYWNEITSGILGDQVCSFNIGTAYRWSQNTTAAANTNKVAAAALNDGNTTTDVLLNNGTNESANMYEAAGVVWSTAQTVGSVYFTNGSWASGKGSFTAGLALQFTTDGTTWTNASGWTVAPAYSYNASNAGTTFKFSGPQVTGKTGFRIIGQCNTGGTGSKEAYIREVEAYANSIKSATITGGVTQVPEIENSDFVKLYPNPANSKITLELSAVKENEKIQIYSILGELVKEVNMTAQRQQINIESLVAGIYIVRLTQSPNLSIKFSKQ